MAVIAQEIHYQKAGKKARVVLTARLPLAGFGREKRPFKEYLLRKEQPLMFQYGRGYYEILIKDVKLRPQW